MATIPTFKAGQVVKLVAGGPDMAVKSQGSTPTSSYTCQWFAGKKLEQGLFVPESLVLVTPTKPEKKP
ncbi:MAG: DUF2158 domain-containing protein [Pseudomonadota bacterium]